MRSKIFSIAIFLVIVVFSVNILSGWREKPRNINAEEIKKSVDKSLLILQRSGHLFEIRSREKCVSCHHQAITSLVAEKARQKGLTLIDSFTNERINGML